MSLSLTPFFATILVVTAVIAGYRYRQTWKSEGPIWKLWLYGAVAGTALLVLGFVPLRADAL